MFICARSMEKLESAKTKTKKIKETQLPLPQGRPACHTRDDCDTKAAKRWTKRAELKTNPARLGKRNDNTMRKLTTTLREKQPFGATNDQSARDTPLLGCRGSTRTSRTGRTSGAPFHLGTFLTPPSVDPCFSVDQTKRKVHT